MKRIRGLASFGGLLCGALALCRPSAAWAADEVGADRDAVDRQGLGNHQRNIRLDIGGRAQYVHSAGLDPFSERDAIGQLSLAASYAFWARERLSLAAVVGFDFGGSSANARSDRAKLDLAHLTLAPEVRYHLLRVLALTGKVGPTLTREAAELDGGLGTLSKTSWKLGFDATAGVAVELWGYENGASHKPRLWLTGEGGYGWTAPMKLNLRPEDSGSAPQRLTPVDLGDLSLAGPLFRITAAISFW